MGASGWEVSLEEMLLACDRAAPDDRYGGWDIVPTRRCASGQPLAIHWPFRTAQSVCVQARILAVSPSPSSRAAPFSNLATHVECAVPVYRYS